MKTAIISDIHDNLSNLEKLLSFAKDENIRALFICGDICFERTLEKITDEFPYPIYLCLGNGDERYDLNPLFKNNKKLHCSPDTLEVEIDGVKIALNHFPATARRLSKTSKYNFVFYGHNHKPWIEETENTILANPGTLGGVLTRATFATFDTKTYKLELKIL